MLVFLNIIVIALIIVFFIKSIRIFKNIKDDEEDEYLREMNKKGSRYMLVAVLLIPIGLFLSFKILIDMFIF